MREYGKQLLTDFLTCYGIAEMIPAIGSTGTLANLRSPRKLFAMLEKVLHPTNQYIVRRELVDWSNDKFDIAILWMKTLQSDIELEFIKKKPVTTVTPKQPKAKRIQADTGGYIYLLQAVLPQSYYKIGLSKVPVDRITKLDVLLPFPIKPLHQFPTNHRYRAEKTLHNRYVHKRVNGEWFELSEQDVADICAIERMDFEGVQS